MGVPADGYPAVLEWAVDHTPKSRWAFPLVAVLAAWVAAGCGDEGQAGSPRANERVVVAGSTVEQVPAPALSVYVNEQAQVATRFSRPVFLQGDVYLTTSQGVSLPLTRESRSAAVAPGGAHELVWDRRAVPGAFHVTGWERGTADWSLTAAGSVAADTDFAPVGVGALTRIEVAGSLPPVPTAREMAELLVGELNEWRTLHGSPPLELGESPAATRHAQLSLEVCISSHWDVHGLKPYLRYALTGGIQYVEENWGGTTSFCVTGEQAGVAPYVSSDDLEKAVGDLVAAFRLSSRHSESLLDPYARYAHVGVAWDSWNLKASVLLERHMVADNPVGLFSLTPDGQLAVWGSFRELAQLLPGAQMRVYFEDFTTPLTQGHLARTSCYTVGRVPLAVVVAPGLEAPRVADVMRPSCPDPAGFDGDSVEEPRSEAEGLALHRLAEQQAGQDEDAVWVVPATIWEQEGRSFRVEANVFGGMTRTGRSCATKVCPGIYTVRVEAVTPDGGVVVVAQQSRWLGGRPPAAAERLYSSGP